MSRRKNPRCAACGRRVRRNQPYMIEVSRETGKEFFYHCRPKCQKLGGWQLAARLHGAIDVYSGFAYEGQRETA